ncbi:MAG: hydroxysqualene dehydroxylase HpnE [Vicinamibacterales bacterium]
MTASAPEVVVIGAGFAGLSAAALLAEAGRRVLVLDARPQLGGRATAFTDRTTGELVDNGQHVLFGCYHQTFEFLRRVGAEANIRLQPAMAVPFLDQQGRRSELRCPPLPPPLHLVGGVLRWTALPLADRLSVLKMAGPLLRARRAIARDPQAVLAPEAVTVSAWLEAAGQGRRIREWLWDPLAVAALNQEPDQASAATFVRVLAELFGPRAADSALAFPVVPLHEAYALPAHAFIAARGGEVRINALARLSAGPSDRPGCLRVEVRGALAATAPVIAAVPWFGLGPLVAGLDSAGLSPIVERAAAMQSKPIVTVNLWYDTPVMDEPFVGLPGRATQWVFDKSAELGPNDSPAATAGARASHLSLVSSAADAMAGKDDAALIAVAVQEIEGALPRARGARLRHATVIREKRATFSLAPGQPTRPATRTPVPGLYLAGDWIDTGLPGTIESAVVSGHRAAHEVLRDGF